MEDENEKQVRAPTGTHPTKPDPPPLPSQHGESVLLDFIPLRLAHLLLFLTLYLMMDLT